MNLWLDASILGLVEGITEFIPVSSTGHLIVAGNLLEFNSSFASTFEVFIQLGAILSVIVIYRNTFLDLFRFQEGNGFAGVRGLALLFLTTLPALIFGALAHHAIKQYLFNTRTVSAGLLLGGVAILVIERLKPQPKKSGLGSLTYRDALLIGLFQCGSLMPGMSRSACTILGAIILGIDRKTAVEYSFFAAVPVLFAATFYDLYKNAATLNASDIPIFAVGFAVAFVSAWAAIKFFVRLISVHTFIPFGWYRVLVAPLIFLLD